MPCTGLSPAMVQLSRRVPLCIRSPRCGPTTPIPPKRNWFGLSPVRSPLLGGSLFVFFSSGYLDVSVPRVSFPLTRDNTTSWYWVAPFGNPWITGYYAPPHGLSQPIASFIASESQGIHHTPLVTFRPLMVLLMDRFLGPSWSVQQYVKERLPLWGVLSAVAFAKADIEWRISESNR